MKKLIYIFILFLFFIKFLYSQISFRFVVLGDSRTQTEIFNECLNQINKLQPPASFILHTGDFINGYKNIEKIKEEWEIMFFNPLKNNLKWKIPIYPVAGNHDICSDLKIYEFYLENIFPYTYYYFVFNNSLFIALNSEEIGYEGKISDTQYNWLKKILEQFKNEKFIKHKFVFVHRPFVPYKSHLDDSLNQDKKMFNKIINLFKEHKIDVIFAGHCHLFNKTFINGILQIITGGAGAPLHSKEENEGVYHFLIVDVNENNFTIKLKDIEKSEPQLIFKK